MGNLLPAPRGVLEDRHVGAALLEVTEAPLNRSRHQDETITLLDVVQRLDQLRQQAGVGALLRAHGVGREVCGPDFDLDLCCRPSRGGQPYRGKH
ncbi:hypothetical protein D3C79_994910 [compost metagenome]